MDRLSNKELEAVKTLRERLADVEHELDDFHRHDCTLMRFLRARDFSVDKAELMFRNNIKWRKEQKLDKILSTDIPDDLIKRFPFKISGYDEEGSYVAVIPIGQYDYRHIVENDLKDSYLQFSIKMSETAYDLWKYKSTPDNFVYQSIAILDYDGFSFSQFTSAATVQFLKEIMTTLEANYPESLKASILVNVPKVFELIFKMFKPFLTKAMLEKMQIFGSNSDEWRQAIRKIAPADHIPSQYGGANTTCFNYTFDMGLDMTPKIVTLSEENMEKVSLPAGQKQFIEIHIPSTGSTLNWNFKTDDYDVGFYVYYDEVSPAAEIIACPRCDSHINVQKGSLPCEKPGKYVLCLDNSYSKFRSKTVYYVTETIPPP